MLIKIRTFRAHVTVTCYSGKVQNKNVYLRVKWHYYSLKTLNLICYVAT